MDNVSHPAYYTGVGIECIDALEAATAVLTGIEAVCTANVIKYLWRWKHKKRSRGFAKSHLVHQPDFRTIGGNAEMTRQEIFKKPPYVIS